MTTNQLLSTLQSNIHALVETVETEFMALPDKALNTKEAPGRWSILECLEHLNRYSRYYNTALAKAIAHAKTSTQTRDEPARSTWLGRKFIAMCHPSNTKKQKTFKSMNPAQSVLDRSVIEEWIHHQEQRLELLNDARSINLNQNHVPIEFFKWLRLNVGDTFQLLVAHEQRHLLQALRVKGKVESVRAPALKV
ncbi:DinB superfamily protein [Chryseolinea serpens]|uniref:DinB superfamily protein n=1 Tax=Chryseolinea serpens TaxID=947013 RepID=A0A1M5XMB7_9BACT|nr:DinB family protein [Chryseolinea serpens]SHI00674.1 DinB superfamily protein [Chryseolinea serpens]